MAMSNNTYLPAGWVRDVANQQCRGPNGEIITEYDIIQHGSFDQALLSRYNQAQMKLHSYRPSNPKVGDVVSNSMITEIYTNNGWVTNHHITNAGAASIVNNGLTTMSPIQPASTLSFDTSHGKVTLDIKTGELTLPVGMGRQDAIREFWLGFQEHFGTTDVDKYKREIADLKHDIQAYKDRATLAEKEAHKEASKKLQKKSCLSIEVRSLSWSDLTI